MHNITLDQANTITAAAFQKGAELGLKPLSVAVLDAGGHLISFQRQDKATSLRFEIARGKASGAIALGISSRQIADMADQRPAFLAALGPLSAHGLIPAAGGVIVLGEDGTAIGAVGITGDSSDNDETCALAGIAAAGLKVQG